MRTLLVEELGVPFDREGTDFHWTLEGGHSIPRVLHVKDETGIPIEQALVAACLKEPNIHWRTGATAVDLLTLSHDSVVDSDRYRPPDRHRRVPARARERRRRARSSRARRSSRRAASAASTSTRPTPTARAATASRWRAAPGRALLNLEYIQFHPTALYAPQGRLLLSEALRGEGREIRRRRRARSSCARRIPAGELAPRDVVARAIHKRMLERDQTHVLLDISHKPADWIRSRFPGMARRCLEQGFDLTAGPVPVVPAAHYSCGGVAADADGRTTLAAPEGGRRGLLHRRPRRQPARLDLSARRAALGLAGRPGRGARGAGRPRPFRPVPALAAGARAGRSGADRAGLDGRPPHDVELRRAAALGEAPRAAPGGSSRSCGSRSRTSTGAARCPTRCSACATASRRRCAIHRAASDNHVSRGCSLPGGIGMGDIGHR